MHVLMRNRHTPKQQTRRVTLVVGYLTDNLFFLLGSGNSMLVCT